jgi:myo-inositol-1(or 4)-monophosphatase
LCLRPHANKIIDFIKEIAIKAGGLILEGSNQLKTINEKSSVADIVTEFDVAVENLLKSEISQKFPDHLFLAEESVVEGQKLTNHPTWIIDPIDGTTNFVATFPCFCASIGFSVNQEILHGVVYNPVTGELFYASKGEGAFLEIRFLKTLTPLKLDKQQTTLSQAVISMGFGVPTIRGSPSDPETVKYQELLLENTRRLQRSCRDIRRIGSAALDLCYVAAGRTDAYYEFGIKEWDIAAGCLILSEAGGSVAKVSGEKFEIGGRNILATCTASLSKEMSSILLNWNYQ